MVKCNQVKNCPNPSHCPHMDYHEHGEDCLHNCEWAPDLNARCEQDIVFNNHGVKLHVPFTIETPVNNRFQLGG